MRLPRIQNTQNNIARCSLPALDLQEVKAFFENDYWRAPITEIHILWKDQPLPLSSWKSSLGIVGQGNGAEGVGGLKKSIWDTERAWGGIPAFFVCVSFLN